MKIRELFCSRLIYGILPIIPIIAFLFVTDNLYNDINNLKTEYIENIKSLEEQKIATINSIIHNRISLAQMQNNKMAAELNKLFDKTYGDNRELIFNEIQTSGFKSKMIGILTHVLNEDAELTRIYNTVEPDHIVFMSNIYGVIEFDDNTFNKSRSYIRFRHWEDVINTKHNNMLAKSALEDILSMKNTIIFWESDYTTRNNPDILIGDCTINNLMFIISSKDESLMKYYNILAPTYIYINKDPNDLIIIREINMFKMIEPFVFQINKYNAMVEEYKFDMITLIFLKIVMCIVIAIALFGSFFLALCSALEKQKEKR